MSSRSVAYWCGRPGRRCRLTGRTLHGVEYFWLGRGGDQDSRAFERARMTIVVALPKRGGPMTSTGTTLAGLLSKETDLAALPMERTGGGYGAQGLMGHSPTLDRPISDPAPGRARAPQVPASVGARSPGFRRPPGRIPGDRSCRWAGGPAGRRPRPRSGPGSE
jgi:hypothetical protein